MKNLLNFVIIKNKLPGVNLELEPQLRAEFDLIFFRFSFRKHGKISTPLYCFQWLIYCSIYNWIFFRYGLPVNFQAMLLQPNKKTMKRLRDVLNALFKHLDEVAAASTIDVSVYSEEPILEPFCMLNCMRKLEPCLQAELCQYPSSFISLLSTPLLCWSECPCRKFECLQILVIKF